VSYVRGPGVQHWHSINTASSGLAAPQLTPSGAAWPTANLAIYVPILVRSRVTIKKLWYSNYTTATGNYDIGLYDSAGVALARKGSTAKSADGVAVVWDCTDTVISSGIYYMALACSNNTDDFGRLTAAAPYMAALGCFSESSFPLPATATFAVSNALAFYPLMGLFLDTRVS